MKRKILYGCLSLMLIFVLNLFVVPVQNCFSDCFAVSAGRKATKDGSVLFGHNEQDGGKIVTRLHVVPRIYHEPGETITFWDTGNTIPQIVGETWAYIWSEIPNLSNADAFFNEWGVAIASNACSSKEMQPFDLTNGGIYYWLRRLVAERAKSAREGVQLIGYLVETYGYASSGRTYTVADPNEVWLCHVVAGRHWLAHRVPDDEVAVLPNRYTTREVDLKDTKNFLGSQDIISYAITKGWYDPSSGEPFDFGKAYGSPSSQNGSSSPIRQWGGLLLVDGKSYPLDDLPFSVKPNRDFTVKDVADVLRTHYEGTDEDQTINGNPHSTGVAVPCAASTTEGAIFQLRRNMPAFIGNVYWRAQGRPCEGVFVPWYLGTLEIPTPYAVGEPAIYNTLPLENRYYDPNSNYWVFNKMDTLVDFDYLVRKPLVRSVWDDMEATEFALQDQIEATALKIYHGQDYHGVLGGDEYLAKWYLTRYSQSLALDAYYKALKFIDEFFAP
jgi:dipeptidase